MRNQNGKAIERNAASRNQLQTIMERSRPRLRRKNLRKWIRFRMIVVPPAGSPLCADFAHNGVSCPVTSSLDHALNVLESTGLTGSGKPVSFLSIQSTQSTMSTISLRGICAQPVGAARLRGLTKPFYLVGCDARPYRLFSAMRGAFFNVHVVR